MVRENKNLNEVFVVQVSRRNKEQKTRIKTMQNL